jgi:ribosomal protein S18 acetylase RimI-like enzyme
VLDSLDWIEPLVWKAVCDEAKVEHIEQAFGGYVKGFVAASEQIVELISTKEIELFLPLMREIDFGDAFLLSMLHWCGIGKRSRPLVYWQVFLLRAKSNIVGVSGLYRQPGMPSHVCWLGWFAIRPQFRRQAFGSAAIRQLCATARNASFKELWVYTGRVDEIARLFYVRLGFEVLGAASDYARGKTMDDSDIVLRRILTTP